MDGRGVAIGMVRSCVVLVFSVSLDVPSTKRQSPPVYLQQRRGVVLGPPLAPTLPHPEPPASLPIACTHTDTRERAFSLPRAHACSHTRDRRIISKTKRVSFPRGGRGSKVEEPQS